MRKLKMWFHMIMDTPFKFRVTSNDGYRSIPMRYSGARDIYKCISYHAEPEIEFIDE